MLFEFVPVPGFDFLNSFSQKFNIPVLQDRLIIPASMGEGSIRRINLEDIKLIVHRYKLHQDFIINRMGTEELNDLVSIIFHSNEETASISTHESQHQLSRNTEFAIQIASSDLNSTVRFPADAEIYFVVIGIRAGTLKKMLDIARPNNVVQTILNSSPGFLFYESMNPDVFKTLKQLTDADGNNELSTLYYRIKVQELLYLLFEKLQKREAVKHSPVNKTDIDKLFLIRTAVLSDLSVTPKLSHLSKMANLSETKMKDLFKQVFGDSIYNYYQKARMEEAAFLLKNGGHSVSEAGYRLGFSNLSHFSRLFEKHHGVKPKKYTTGG